jgi:hypothetical protein
MKKSAHPIRTPILQNAAATTASRSSEPDAIGICVLKPHRRFPHHIYNATGMFGYMKSGNNDGVMHLVAPNNLVWATVDIRRYRLPPTAHKVAEIIEAILMDEDCETAGHTAFDTATDSMLVFEF